MGLKKGVFLLLTTLGFAFLGVSCYPVVTVPLAPTPVPTTTATAAPTPVCGFRVLTPTDTLALGAGGISVIHDESQWVQFLNQPGTPLLVSLTPVPTPTPGPPPVDFSQEMLVVIGDSCPCHSLTTWTVTGVCVGPSEVTVDVASDTCETCMLCEDIPTRDCIVQEVAVPQSSLPVSFVITYSFH